jgi:hypothetical protein
MTQLNPIPNPFALMMDPESVFRALESSDRLGRLKSRICRPLDKPLIAKSGDEVAEFDQAIEVDPTMEMLGVPGEPVEPDPE